MIVFLLLYCILCPCRLICYVTEYSYFTISSMEVFLEHFLRWLLEWSWDSSFFIHTIYQILSIDFRPGYLSFVIRYNQSNISNWRWIRWPGYLFWPGCTLQQMWGSKTLDFNAKQSSSFLSRGCNMKRTTFLVSHPLLGVSLGRGFKK